MFIDSKKGKKRNKEASFPLERTTLHMTKLKPKRKRKTQTYFTRNPRTQSKEGMVVAQSKVRVKASLVQHPIHK
jgi:hypothetical protein